jgi:hypothetical protein
MRIVRRTTTALWLILGVLVATVAGASIDPSALAFSGNERISAVFLLDGQAYFGRLDDQPWSNDVSLRDVYYFGDASQATTDFPVALVKRGSEIHHPADGMTIRRDKILAVERVSIESPVGKAIAAQRALDQVAAGK